MKKLIIYPFTYDCRELVQYKQLLDGYELIAVVVPDYSYDILKNICECASVKISTCFNEVLYACDTVLFLGSLYDRLKIEYLENIKLAKDAGKSIIIDNQLGTYNIDILKSEYELLYATALDTTKINTEKLRRINVPVIGIFGIGKYCNKFGCEIMLGQYFRNKDVKVLQIASKEIASLFGLEVYPDFMNDNNYTEFDRTIMLNHYIYNLIDSEKPDLVIIGVDEPVMPFNTKILNGFGHQAIMVGDALSIDCGILGLSYSHDFLKETFEKYHSFCQFRFNTIIDCFLHSNTEYLVDADNSGLINYYHLNATPKTGVVEIDNTKFPLFAMEDSESIENAFHTVYSILIDNIDVF